MPPHSANQAGSRRDRGDGTVAPAENLASRSPRDQPAGVQRPAWRRLLSGLTVALALALSASAAHGGVDLRATRIGDTGVWARVRGGTVRLTLDPELQRGASAMLGRSRARRGALVASDPRTGRVLVWASLGGDRDQVSEPTAPSASLFKVVTASALLESGRASAGTRRCWHGGERAISLADLADDRERDTACATMGEALRGSVNLVFAKLAVAHLQPSDLLSQAALLGFVDRVPIDVDVAPSTLRVPADDLGLARASAGFWNGRLSPLGALFAMQTIANGGERVRLRVLAGDPEDARTADGRAMSGGTALALRSMLEDVVRRGTAARYFHGDDGARLLPGVRVAGKTGTLIGGSPQRMYSWFAGFAGRGERRVVVAVLLCNDVAWWAKAGEVARDFLELYFED
jgi:cell division protein FtsI/penicillin-binding protein 2